MAAYWDRLCHSLFTSLWETNGRVLPQSIHKLLKSYPQKKEMQLAFLFFYKNQKKKNKLLIYINFIFVELEINVWITITVVVEWRIIEPVFDIRAAISRRYAPIRLEEQ